MTTAARVCRRVVILLVFLPGFALASTVPQYEVGKDYKVVPQSSVQTVENNSTVQVVEFFSYSCPWCYRMESSIELWLKNKPAQASFSRVPVVFRPSWVVLAKAYYTAKALGLADKLTATIFHQIHKEGKDLTNRDAMEKVFVANGVSNKEFESAFNYSPSIDTQLNSGEALARKYKVTGIPMIVVGGKYYTTSALAKGDGKRMMQIVNFLVEKVAKKTSVNVN